MNRRLILESLIQYTIPIERISADLGLLPWDSEEELVELREGDIIKILERYVNGELSAQSVESWANLIECREDIKMSNRVTETILILANPALNGVLSIEGSRKLIARLLQR
jgi:hypothetical protein